MSVEEIFDVTASVLTQNFETNRVYFIGLGTGTVCTGSIDSTRNILAVVIY